MKKVFITLFSLILIISMVTCVYAATSGNVEVNSSSTTVKAGEAVTITVSASDTNNLNAVGYTNITITDSNGVDSSSSFDIKPVEIASTNVSGSLANEGKTYFMMNAGEFKTSDIFKVEIRALDTVKEGTYNVNINGLVVENKTYALGTAEEKTTTVGTKTAQITAITDTTIIDDGSGTNSSQPSSGEETPSTTTPENGDGSTSGRIVEASGDNDSEDKTLPQTGIEYTWIIAVAGLSIIAIVSFVSYKKYKNI